MMYFGAVVMILAHGLKLALAEGISREAAGEDFGGRREEAVRLDPGSLEDTNVARIIEEFRRSKERILVLDYDGTLTDIVASPPMAAPTQEIKDLLVDLNKVCRVVICTGRGLDVSDKFFPREIEVFAEHGACHRVKGEWKIISSLPQRDLDIAWRIGEFFHQRTPGTRLSKRTTGYAFHYRNASPLIGVKQGKALFELLEWVFGDSVIEGRCIVEIRSSKKSSVMESVGKGFVLCAGDDIADEEMFEASPGYTIKVGDQETSAAYRVKNPQSFRMLLARLLE